MPLPQPAAQDDTLSELLELINRQLAEKNLKVEKASAAVIDAAIIQTAGSKQRQAIEVDEEGYSGLNLNQDKATKPQTVQLVRQGEATPYWFKFNPLYIEKLHITPANTHECKHLSPLLEGLSKGTTVYADKGYDSEENR